MAMMSVNPHYQQHLPFFCVAVGERCSVCTPTEQKINTQRLTLSIINIPNVASG
jgi:hypothetical protein